MTRFKPGDSIFASTFAVNFGGHAEYKCLPESGVLALKPANLTSEEAAAIPGAGQTAWRCLQKGKIHPEQNILIYGASGAVGTNAAHYAQLRDQAQADPATAAVADGLAPSIAFPTIIRDRTIGLGIPLEHRSSNPARATEVAATVAKSPSGD